MHTKAAELAALAEQWHKANESFEFAARSWVRTEGSTSSLNVIDCFLKAGLCDLIISVSSAPTG